VVRALLNDCLNDLIQNSLEGISRSGFATLQDVFSVQPAELPVGNSPDMRMRLQTMHSFLKRSLYMDPAVKRMSFRGEKMIEYLFHTYMERPDLMPSHVQERVTSVGLERVIADYISGMTDRFAEKEYVYLSGGS